MEVQFVLTCLAALAHNARLGLFRELVVAGPAGLAAGELANRFELPAATASFHLKELRHAGLVSQRRNGRSIMYAANYPVMNGLIAYLTENCCQGAACLSPGDAGKRRARGPDGRARRAYAARRRV